MRGGFSLVEAAVAMTLLAVGMLGVAAGGLLASRLLREAAIEEAATWHAGNLLDSLVVFGSAGVGAVLTPHYRLDWHANADSAAVTARFGHGMSFTLREMR